MNHVLVFHCEFSSERGPKLFRQLRALDRDVNRNSYPQLNFPEVYMLKGIISILFFSVFFIYTIVYFFTFYIVYDIITCLIFQKGIIDTMQARKYQAISSLINDK